MYRVCGVSAGKSHTYGSFFFLLIINSGNFVPFKNTQLLSISEYKYL